ncbi:MAG TPA: hypothetical protein VKO63_09005 [Chitinispirillaceae bacterium]|nr:hypothetical protein [Chitinispirillaceae bacterium]
MSIILSVFSYENNQSMFRSSLSDASLLHGVGSNPSLLASDGNLMFGLQLPLPFSLTLQVKSSVLTLPNPIKYLSDSKKIDMWIARMLIESFELDGLSPSMVSTKLTSYSKNDIKVWMNAQIPYLKIAAKKNKDIFYGWGFNIESVFDGYVNIPGQVLAAVFSTDKGLQPGNMISFETLKSECEFVTEIQTGWARAWDVSMNVHNRTLFDRIQFGFGFTQRMGHIFYELTADSLYVDYTEPGVMHAKGNILIKSSGIKDDGSTDKLNINGYGLSMSTGLVLQNDYFSIAASLTNLGAMGWYDKKNYANVSVDNDSLYLYDIFTDKKDSVITTVNNNGGTIKYMLSPVLTGLISARFPLNEGLKPLISYQLLSLGYKVSSEKIGKFGRGYTASFDMESGIAYGKIPIRLGWTYSEHDMMSSTVSMEIVSRYLTYDIWYRASGDWLFRAKKGAEFGFCFHIYSGFKPLFKSSVKESERTNRIR